MFRQCSEYKHNEYIFVVWTVISGSQHRFQTHSGSFEFYSVSWFCDPFCWSTFQPQGFSWFGALWHFLSSNKKKRNGSFLHSDGSNSTTWSPSLTQTKLFNKICTSLMALFKMMTHISRAASHCKHYFSGRFPTFYSTVISCSVNLHLSVEFDFNIIIYRIQRWFGSS